MKEIFNINNIVLTESLDPKPEYFAYQTIPSKFFPVILIEDWF